MADGCARGRFPSGCRVDLLGLEPAAPFPASRVQPDRDDTAERIEIAMAALARAGNGRGRFRVVSLRGPAPARHVFPASAACEGAASLAEAVASADGRPCDPLDLVFPLPAGALPAGADASDILRAAIHFVAAAVATRSGGRFRGLTYAGTCVSLLSSIGNDGMTRELADDFLRMWLRAELDAGDPPEWNHANADAVRARDAVAGAFMEGVGEATKAFPPLELPAALDELSQGAERLVASAVLWGRPAAGSA